MPLFSGQSVNLQMVSEIFGQKIQKLLVGSGAKRFNDQNVFQVLHIVNSASKYALVLFPNDS